MNVAYRFRFLEMFLLLLAGAITLGGFAYLSEVQHHRVVQRDLIYPAIFVGSTFVFSLWMGRFAPWADQIVLPVAATVSGVGLLVITRLSTDLGHKQVIWTLLGEIAAMAVLVRPRSISTFSAYKYTWATVGLLLIVATIVRGTDINGSGYSRWIGFHGVYFQPVELLKILMVIFFAGYLEEKHELLSAARLKFGPIAMPPFQYLAPLIAVWGISLVLLIKQNDLGSALLFLGIFLAMIYVGTARAVYPVMGLGMYAIGVYVAFHIFPHIRDRTEVWLDPWTHSGTSGFQLVRGLIALGVGGIGGQGLGQGMPYTVPVVTTDFILAAIGEELGMAGAAALLLLLLYLVFRGLAVAIRSADGFQKLLATGLMATVAIQTIVIVGGTSRLMPLTGVPLPFLSYGGSAALANYIMLGLLLKISSEASRARRWT